MLADSFGSLLRSPLLIRLLYSVAILSAICWPIPLALALVIRWLYTD